jgi:hypothetical protein
LQRPAAPTRHRSRSSPGNGTIPRFPAASRWIPTPTSLTNLSRRDGVSNPAQLVGDYSNPILKPETAKIVKQQGELSLAEIGYPTPRNQCWPGGLPFEFANNGLQMLQKPDEVLIVYRGDHQVRHVRLNQPHPEHVAPSWYGDSVGHHEGNTLVVDTVAVRIGPFAMVDWLGTPRSAALHMVERYRLLDYRPLLSPSSAVRKRTSSRISAKTPATKVSIFSSTSRSMIRRYSPRRGRRQSPMGG